MLRAMALTERDVSFFRPLWIRILITAVLAAWCLGEVVLSHDQLWIGVTAFGVAYCVYNFFWKFPKTAAALPPPASGTPTATEMTPPAEAPAPEPPKQP